VTLASRRVRVDAEGDGGVLTVGASVAGERAQSHEVTPPPCRRGASDGMARFGEVVSRDDRRRAVVPEHEQIAVAPDVNDLAVPDASRGGVGEVEVSAARGPPSLPPLSVVGRIGARGSGLGSSVAIHGFSVPPRRIAQSFPMKPFLDQCPPGDVRDSPILSDWVHEVIVTSRSRVIASPFGTRLILGQGGHPTVLGLCAACKRSERPGVTARMATGRNAGRSRPRRAGGRRRWRRRGRVGRAGVT
jgi:hypothetical protein